MPQDLFCISILKSAKINRCTHRAIIQISDICQNNSAGTNGEICFTAFFRGGIFVIVCGLILISVLPGSVGHEIHFFHNLSTAFYTDTDIELAP